MRAALGAMRQATTRGSARAGEEPVGQERGHTVRDMEGRYAEERDAQGRVHRGGGHGEQLVARREVGPATPQTHAGRVVPVHCGRSGSGRGCSGRTPGSTYSGPWTGASLEGVLVGRRTRSKWSLASHGSILSIGSTNSILSIGSAGSILSIGSVASFASIGSVGSAMSALSFLSHQSRLSALSHQSDCSVLSAQSKWSVRGYRSHGR